MSAATHTPGPWQVVPATEHHGFYITSDFGNTICDLYTMSNPSLASTANGGPSKPVRFMHEMDGPNARLIAAAPDLFEACAAFIDRFDGGSRADTDYVSSMMRAAIAKAHPMIDGERS